MSTPNTTTEPVDNENQPVEKALSSDASPTKEDDKPEMTEEDMAALRSGRIKKIIIGLVLLAFIVFVIVDSFTTGIVRDAIDSFLSWVEDNPIPGVFAFMAVYFFATILFVPGSILTLGAGFVFANAFGLGVGVLLGTTSVFFGASGGATVSFLLGRFLFRNSVEKLASKYTVFQALDLALAEKGFRIMTLLRLSPIIPFNAINYIAGVTALNFWSYVLALLGILPGTTLYVFLGASAGSLADSAGSGNNMTVTIIVVVVGVVFGIGAIFLTSYYAKKELNRVVAEREAAESADASSSEVPANVA